MKGLNEKLRCMILNLISLSLKFIKFILDGLLYKFFWKPKGKITIAKHSVRFEIQFWLTFSRNFYWIYKISENVDISMMLVRNRNTQNDE